MSKHTLTIEHHPESEFSFGMPDGCTDLLAEGGANRLILSAVRFVLREYACERMPIVLGLAQGKPDKWGNSIHAEVQYGKTWATVIAGKYIRVNNRDGDLVGVKVEWTVYAD